MNVRWIALVALSLVLVGCSKEAAKSGATQREPQGESKGATHAPSGVVPGSYEDWCNEHQVPETACTRCDPSLVAAFKATNDWCAEHGVPESQCLKCDPNLKIVRPPKQEGM